KNTIIMETGGMKGKRKEIIREELHSILSRGFGVSNIHSEYGMTELLSQAYSLGNGIFECPSWMQILVRDTEDALTYVDFGKTGGVNVIDLANINSCSFIATQDLGKKYNNNSFEILGRFDNSDIRGCNLMVI
ncbi:MAG TPA: acyl transferase, partial [Flavobacterium sp.]|nr:acyl transferase [Flavobacterium sp.]